MITYERNCSGLGGGLLCGFGLRLLVSGGVRDLGFRLGFIRGLSCSFFCVSSFLLFYGVIYISEGQGINCKE